MPASDEVSKTFPAAHQLRLDAGRRGIAEWELEHGVLTVDELAEGLAQARSLLRRLPDRESERPLFWFVA